MLIYQVRRAGPFAVALIALVLGRQSRAQDTTASMPSTSQRQLVLIGSPADEAARTRELRTRAGTGRLLRSPSSLGWTRSDSVRFALVLPHVRVVNNSLLPYSLNDGSMWAGRGTSGSVVFGAVGRIGALRVAILPELTASNNESYALAQPGSSPVPPASRSAFSSPWHAGAQSIDLPIRFGQDRPHRAGPGQSSLVLRAGKLEVGGATENEWWGPGIRNSLLLSNNAAGFPHLLLRTASPVATPIGSVEARWIAGGLTESDFFDFDSSNDLRSISLLGVTLQPKGAAGLTVGVARSVFGTTSSWSSALSSFPDVLRDVGQPNAVAPADSVPLGGKDQLISIFARWVFPASGFEAYGEIGRAEFPVSLRDFLEQPNHTEGYTAGLQWLGEPAWYFGRIRVQAEATYLEQSTTFRFRRIGSWYTSHAVPQGYTERGQTLGAAIGPGSSSQWLAIDMVHESWQAGAYLTRIRWLEDAHSQLGDPLSSCSHDVALLPGFRGRADTPLGTAFAELTVGTRLNVFFPQPSCGEVRDERNKSLSIGFSPRLWTR